MNSRTSPRRLGQTVLSSQTRACFIFAHMRNETLSASLAAAEIGWYGKDFDRARRVGVAGHIIATGSFAVHA